MLRTPSGPSIYERMSTTRMGINPPETISHEDGPNPEPDGGHRQPLPWGSVPFSGISAGDRSTALPQLYRPLSGFLTVSAVFSHPNLVALFHATSAPRILVFRAFPSSPAAISLDIRCSPVVSPAPWSCRLPVVPVCPCYPSPASPIFSGEQFQDPVTHLRITPDIVLADHSTFVEWPGLASGPCNPEGWRATFTRCAPHPRRVNCSNIEQARASTSEP